MAVEIACMLICDSCGKRKPGCARAISIGLNGARLFDLYTDETWRITADFPEQLACSQECELSLAERNKASWDSE